MGVVRNMGCSCHINPPCNYCTELYECKECGKLKHPDEDGFNEGHNENGDGVFCNDCLDNLSRFLYGSNYDSRDLS